MKQDEKRIAKCKQQVYETLVRLSLCTMAELQSSCKMKDTELCLSLLHLIKEGKIRQERHRNTIYYRIVSK